jgi:transcriptional regulator with XRE-family HTH domain
MTSETKNKFGSMLLEKRKESGLSQRDCAKSCGVSVVSYQNWERGICEPKEDKLILICDLFGISKSDYED